jgi:hypothetical protein
MSQRTSLDIALASTSLHRMALRFEDVKICRRPDGSLWKLGSGGFGTVSASWACRFRLDLLRSPLLCSAKESGPWTCHLGVHSMPDCSAPIPGVQSAEE